MSGYVLYKTLSSLIGASVADIHNWNDIHIIPKCWQVSLKKKSFLAYVKITQFGSCNVWHALNGNLQLCCVYINIKSFVKEYHFAVSVQVILFE